MRLSAAAGTSFNLSRHGDAEQRLLAFSSYSNRVPIARFTHFIPRKGVPLRAW